MEKIKHNSISRFFKLATTSAWIGKNAKIKTAEKRTKGGYSLNKRLNSFNNNNKQQAYNKTLTK